MNEPGGQNAPLSTIYENAYVSNVDPLKVNGLTPNFIVLGDSLELGEGSIDNGDGPFNAFTKESVDESSNKDVDKNFGSLDMRHVATRLSSSIRSLIDLRAAMHRNERWAF